MLFFLFAVAAMFFIASLLPYMFPGSLISLLGSFLNHRLAVSVGGMLPRWGLEDVGDGYALSLEGVLFVYLPVLAVVYLWMRR